MVDDLSAQKATWRPQDRILHDRWVSQVKKLTKSKKTCDIVVLDPNLNRNCMQFYSTVCEYLLYQMEDRKIEGPFINKIKPNLLNAGDVFSSLPVWIIEDIAEFLLFCLQ